VAELGKPKPQLWVKVVANHSIKTYMGLVLAVCSGLSLVVIACGAVWNTVANPAVTDLSEGFLTLLGTSLGTIFGGIIGYLSGQQFTNPETGEKLSEGDIALRIDEPPEDPPAVVS